MQLLGSDIRLRHARFHLSSHQGFRRANPLGSDRFKQLKPIEQESVGAPLTRSTRNDQSRIPEGSVDSNRVIDGDLGLDPFDQHIGIPDRLFDSSRSIDRALRDPRSTFRLESIDRSSPKGSPIDFSIRVDRSSPKGSPIDFSIRVDRSIEP